MGPSIFVNYAKIFMLLAIFLQVVENKLLQNIPSDFLKTDLSFIVLRINESNLRSKSLKLF